MSKLYLEKFPITSKSGTEYLVIISEDPFYNDSVEVALYEKLNKKTIFGKEKIRALNREHGGFFPSYEESKWGYDYKAMAINEVKKFEESIKEKIEKNAKRLANELKFNDWDGKID